MLWFVSASLVSLLLGLIMVNILRPGDNLNLPYPMSLLRQISMPPCSR
jgi:Na+/H+-dicarboxylate symporter